MKNVSNNKKMSGQEGFSLVELMIVVAIIGLLAALALPRFETFRYKAMQSEAKANLGYLHTLQSVYFSENDKYSKLDEMGGAKPQVDNLLGFKITGKTKYTISATTTNSDLNYASKASATLGSCTNQDVWASSDTGQITSTHDVTKDGC